MCSQRRCRGSSGARLATRERPALDDAFQFAIERHRSSADYDQDPVGFIAFGVTALAGLAFDAGLTLAIEGSDYLPMRLVRGDCR